ncbi:6-hydroxynicotinate 3-monooxygenase [Parachaetomium inaequale]|uniref:6-hydroxynicotinate 3-monooxygenase n=1 Tax=Parachaetomium inaequale TaxID=2588326 RepID=A0AAN6PDV7_9PEZI|nr:6-hydroxynicotinate 3-monooxygenase [Parachaetomium inaequale]
MANAIKDIQNTIIIGGGPAAVLAALRLHRSNSISPVLYEIRPKPTTLGGAIGIPANGLRLLNQLGLYEECVAKSALTSKLVLHALNGCVMGEMDMADWSEKQTGFGYLRIRRTDLMDVLLAAAERENIPIHFGKVLTAIEEKDGRVLVQFADGTTDSADFLLGCDGIHSSVRKLYVDPDVTPEYTGIANMFSLIPAGHDLTTASESGPIANLNATLTSDGLFAISPTTPASDLLYWFFSREVPLPASDHGRDGWEATGKTEVDRCKTTLLQLLGEEKSEWVDMLRQLVQRTETVKFYPIYKLPTGRPWFRGRCLIIGDAAHAMPPHASQGVSMALEDVFLLSTLLKSEHLALDQGLAAYVTKRKLRTDAMLKKAERNGTVRKQTSPWRVRANELAISGGLWLYKTTGLERLGIGQRDLAYDVETEKF